MTAPARPVAPLRAFTLFLLMGATGGMLAGCGALPSSGPLAMEVSAQEAGEDQIGGYILVPIDERVTAVTAAQPQPSLRRVFPGRIPAPDLRIGIGDSITVTIWEAASGGLFSAAPNTPGALAGARTATLPEQVVGRDGTIGIPYAGRLRVVGMLPSEVETSIVEKLEGLAIKPQAVVTIAGNASNTVVVNGEATQGAVIPLNPKGNRLLEVLAKAGKITQPVQETVIRLTRANTTAAIAFNEVLTRPEENIFLRPGDVLTVVHDPPTFTVFGGTLQNARVPLTAQDMTLEEALAKVGGLNDLRADPAGIFLLRFEPAKLAHELAPDRPMPSEGSLVPVIYRLNLRSTNSFFLARAFKMKNKDIVYIANSPSDTLVKFLRIVTPVVSALRGGFQTYEAYERTSR